MVFRFHGFLGFAHRFCRELAGSIANLRVWAQGFKPKGLPIIPGLLWMLEPLGLVSDECSKYDEHG
jgi:hypothetical protein